MSGTADSNAIVDGCLDTFKEHDLEANQEEFDAIVKLIRRYHVVNETARCWKSEPGTGWLQILCRKQGIPCRGLEIDPQLVEYAHELAAHQGVSLDIAAHPTWKKQLALRLMKKEAHNQ